MLRAVELGIRFAIVKTLEEQLEDDRENVKTTKEGMACLKETDLMYELGSKYRFSESEFKEAIGDLQKNGLIKAEKIAGTNDRCLAINPQWSRYVTI